MHGDRSTSPRTHELAIMRACKHGLLGDLTTLFANDVDTSLSCSISQRAIDHAAGAGQIKASVVLEQPYQLSMLRCALDMYSAKVRQVPVVLGYVSHGCDVYYAACAKYSRQGKKYTGIQVLLIIYTHTVQGRDDALLTSIARCISLRSFCTIKMYLLHPPFHMYLTERAKGVPTFVFSWGYNSGPCEFGT